MEKKTYIQPQSEIIEFESEDIITASGCSILSTGDASCNELPIVTN